MRSVINLPPGDRRLRRLAQGDLREVRVCTSRVGGMATSPVRVKVGMTTSPNGSSRGTTGPQFELPPGEGERNEMSGRMPSKEEAADKAQATWASTARKVAFEYNQDNSCRVLLSVKGTFWPYVFRTYELYLFPLVHAGLVIRQWAWMQEEDEDGEPQDAPFWQGSANMIPWASVGMLTPLMTFALVFFLSQCCELRFRGRTNNSCTGGVVAP